MKALALAILVMQTDTSVATARRPQGDGLRLEVAPASSPGKEPRLRVSIVNGSDRSLWVNKRMLWNTEGAPKQARELLLEIQDEKGERQPFRCKVNAGASGPLDYVLLQPGGLVGRIVKLDCVTLRPGVRYRVVVRYQDHNEAVKLQPEGPRLDWELVSEPIEITG